MKVIETKGIQFIEPLASQSEWYCGTDFSCGELYEAEELYYAGERFEPNRLIFIHHPDGEVVEPITLEKNQYFGRPIQIKGVIYIILVDFDRQIIQIYDCDDGFQSVSLFAEILLSEVADCNNLLLRGEPLMVTRQGAENKFEVIWPEKLSFAVDETEAFIYRDGEEWVFSRWREDPIYREETVLRRKDGSIIEVLPGNLFITPAGEKWILR